MQMIMLYGLTTFFSFCCTVHLIYGRVIEPVLEISEKETNISDGIVTETQHAICRIVTEEVAANARASVTRVLNGSCDAKTMNEKFENLEKNLIEKFAEIKTILYYAILEQSIDIPKVKNSLTIDSENVDQRNSYRSSLKYDKLLSPRYNEISKYNGTIQQVTESISAFTYYWEVQGFDKKLDSWETGRFERSPTFSVGERGYAMYLSVTPRYFPDGTVFVGVGLTRGCYDSVLEWPFSRETQVEILDQSVKARKEDRSSRIWDPSMLCSEYFWGRPKLTGPPDNPVCVGLSVARHEILSKLSSFSSYDNKYTRFLWNGSIFVKLTVFLSNTHKKVY